jgi:hypothetical protein
VQWLMQSNDIIENGLTELLQSGDAANITYVKDYVQHIENTLVNDRVAVGKAA